MKTALSIWQGKISPMLDTASSILVVEYTDGRESTRCVESLDGLDFCHRADRLVKLAPEHLICGVVSHQLEAVLESEGIKVHKLVCGEIETVIEAFINGTLDSGKFRMPFCRGRRRKFRCGRFVDDNSFETVYVKEANMRSGGRDSGRGKGFGRSKGASFRGAGGYCICPGCGYRVEHVQGKPCMQINCPQCGTRMTRE